jgi:hypothetical protein
VRPLAIVRIPLAYVLGPPPGTRPVIKRGLAASTDVPVITAAPTRDEHDFDASHCPVSFDRPLEQDREMQTTTPRLRMAAPSARGLRPTMTGLQGGEKTQHIADRVQILPARRPPRDQLRHPPGAASRAKFHG